jgi:hypothetical protein
MNVSCSGRSRPTIRCSRRAKTHAAERRRSASGGNRTRGRTRFGDGGGCRGLTINAAILKQCTITGGPSAGGRRAVAASRRVEADERSLEVGRLPLRHTQSGVDWGWLGGGPMRVRAKRAPETACGSGARAEGWGMLGRGDSARRRPFHSSATSKRTERAQCASRAGADRDGDSADDATYRVGGGDGLSARSARRDPATTTKVER